LPCCDVCVTHIKAVCLEPARNSRGPALGYTEGSADGRDGIRRSSCEWRRVRCWRRRLPKVPPVGQRHVLSRGGDGGSGSVYRPTECRDGRRSMAGEARFGGCEAGESRPQRSLIHILRGKAYGTDGAERMAESGFGERCGLVTCPFQSKGVSGGRGLGDS